MKLCSPRQAEGDSSHVKEEGKSRLPHSLWHWSSCRWDSSYQNGPFVWFSLSCEKWTENMNNSLFTRRACRNLCSVNLSSVVMSKSGGGCVLVSGQSVLGWCCSDGRVLGRGSEGRRWEVYMASKASSGRSGFLRPGVPCAAPGSPLGGDGRLGAISAALALSSRNLSNSGSIRSKERGIREEAWSKCGWKVRGKGDLCFPTFARHAFLTFISFLLGKKKENNVTPGSWLCKTESTANNKSNSDPVQTTHNSTTSIPHTLTHHCFYHTTRSHLPLISTHPQLGK